MKSTAVLLLLAAAVVRLPAATPLHIGQVDTLSGGPCWYDASLGPGTTGPFAISGLSGSGQVSSYILFTVNPPPPGTAVFRNLFVYTLDLRDLTPPAGHCVRLSIPFGMPVSCDFDNDGLSDQVVVLKDATGSAVPIESATLSGNSVQILFGTSTDPCLLPGRQSITFAMLSDRPFVTNQVTVIDAQGSPVTNTVSVTAQALVPNLPLLFAPRFEPLFQGVLRGKDGIPLSGLFDLSLFLRDETNGLPASEVIVETVRVQDGMFNIPLRFNPSTFHAKPRLLSVAVRTNSNNPSAPFTPLDPLLPLTPAPRAFYADEAGYAGALSPGTAVASLNNLTDALVLKTGPGLVLDNQGNILTLSLAQGQISAARDTAGSTALNPPESDMGSAFADIQALSVQVEELRLKLNASEAEVRELTRRLEQLEKARHQGRSIQTK